MLWEQRRALPRSIFLPSVTTTTPAPSIAPPPTSWTCSSPLRSAACLAPFFHHLGLQQQQARPVLCKYTWAQMSFPSLWTCPPLLCYFQLVHLPTLCFAHRPSHSSLPSFPLLPIFAPTPAQISQQWFCLFACPAPVPGSLPAPPWPLQLAPAVFLPWPASSPFLSPLPSPPIPSPTVQSPR